MKIGYIRCSSEHQNTARQDVLMEELGVDEVFIDKLSGKNTDRPQLKKLLSYVRKGDVVIVSEISRFARNTRDLLELIDMLTEKDVEFISQKEAIDTSTPIALFGNKYQYYHYYTDHILFAMGQINNRFKFTKNDSNSLRERKQANRKNFKFAEEQYPILSDKNGRNMIEHIDEYNQMTIDALNGVGGFNVIGLETNDELIQCLKTNRSTHPYTLDLVGERILIFRKGAEIDINVVELERELNSLKKNVEDLKNMITI